MMNSLTQFRMTAGLGGKDKTWIDLDPSREITQRTINLLPHFKSQIPLWRLSFPVLLSILEVAVFRVTVHGSVKAGIGASFVFQWALAWLSIFVLCGCLKYAAALREFVNELANSYTRLSLLYWHFAALSLVAFVTWIVLHARFTFLSPIYLIGIWYLALLVAMACGVLCFLRVSAIQDVFRRTGLLWLYAALGGLGAVWGISDGRGYIVSAIWIPSTRLTFFLVKLLLRPLVAVIVSNPHTASIGTERFIVTIGYACSGMEGVILIFVFSAAWLCFFRAELRFPRSLLLIPASMVLIFLLNSVRIALLILIGDVGAKQIALGGFHSNAGWVFYVGVAIGLMYMAQSTWLQQGVVASNMVPISASASGLRVAGSTFAEENATAIYLAPLFAIIATALITRVASAGFDWFYPVRFVAAATVLWIYRHKYLSLDWHFSGRSVFLGAVVFLLWIVPLPTGADTGSTLGAFLDSLPRWGRALWLTFRVLGAVLTAPIAEELAFRGYALRRLQLQDFESVNWRAFTSSALLISSLIFGLMHGGRWIVGTAAGIVYAAAMLRRGRIGDAAVAHATTNALLAAWVIMHGAWYLW
jgi:exosortase E/protease (VPEID-CTERM system)